MEILLCFYIVSTNFSKQLSSCKNEKLSNIYFLIFKVKLIYFWMLLESLFSKKKKALINDNHVAIKIFWYFDKTESQNWSSKRAFWCAKPFFNENIYPYMYICATLFTQIFFWIRYFLHIITIVHSLLYLVHNSSLPVLLSAKEHHNCNVNTKTFLFISGTIMIPFSL